MNTIQQIQQLLGVKPDGIWGVKSEAALDLLIDSPKSSGLNARSEHNITTLHPKVQPLVRALVRKAQENGIDIQITSGTRTYAEQDALYAQGGVTKARGGYSNHNFGLAFDVTIFKNGQPVWESPKYETLGVLGKKLGLSWGGDWTSFKDEPHFELRPEWAFNMSESNMLAELRARHNSGQAIFA